MNPRAATICTAPKKSQPVLFATFRRGGPTPNLLKCLPEGPNLFRCFCHVAATGFRCFPAILEKAKVKISLCRPLPIGTLTFRWGSMLTQSTLETTRPQSEQPSPSSQHSRQQRCPPNSSFSCFLGFHVWYPDQKQQ